MEEGVRFNSAAISPAVRPASSISESRLSSPDVQRLAGDFEVMPAGAARSVPTLVIPGSP